MCFSVLALGQVREVSPHIKYSILPHPTLLMKRPCGLAVSAPNFGSRGLGEARFFLNLNNASLQRAFHVHPSVVLILLKYRWKGRKPQLIHPPIHIKTLSKPTQNLSIYSQNLSIYSYLFLSYLHFIVLGRDMNATNIIHTNFNIYLQFSILLYSTYCMVSLHAICFHFLCHVSS